MKIIRIKLKIKKRKRKKGDRNQSYEVTISTSMQKMIKHMYHIPGNGHTPFP